MIPRRTEARISIEALESNLSKIRSLAGKAKVCAVVKADAYGHGVLPVARALERSGVDFMATALLEEALDLRSAGIHTPILIFGAGDPANAEILVEQGLSQTVFDLDMPKALSEAAVRLGKSANVHLKIDTGLRRQGVEPYEAAEFAKKVAAMPGLRIEGTYSHFADADNPDKSFADQQLSVFMQALEAIRRAGVDPGIRHIANSAGLIFHPESHLDMVRPGIALYGLSPSGSIHTPEGFMPVMKLVSTVVHLRWIGAGETVSYGRIFSATRPTRLAVISIGYADGYSRLLSNKAPVAIRGKLAPIAGRVCMDQLMADVTDIGEVAIGDEAVLFGTKELPAGVLANIMGTIDYEISCSVSKRVPRVFSESRHAR